MGFSPVRKTRGGENRFYVRFIYSSLRSASRPLPASDCFRIGSKSDLLIFSPISDRKINKKTALNRLIHIKL